MSEATLPPFDEHGLVRWAPKAPTGGPGTVADVLDPVLASAPDRLALVDDAGAMSYAELDRQVNRVARVLRAKGLRSGDRIAMSLPNSADVVVGFLAAMRLGLVWVGINASLRPPEVEAILEDSDPTIVITEPGRPITAGWRTVPLDERWRAQVAAAPDTRPEGMIDPYAPAAIAYTSGTTGTPKGAVHSQHNILLPGLILLLDDTIPAESRQGVALPLTILNLQILGPVASFLAGATCVVLSRIDVLGLAEGVRRHGVDRVSVPPTSAYDLLTRPDVMAEDLASLAELRVGGAAAPPGLNERYRARFGHSFSTSYGLTEVPTSVTMETREHRPDGSAGHALRHVLLRITDPDGVELPSGMEGEIRVGPRREGPFADVFRPMLGYWNRPDATRQVLTGDGELRTGDQGRIEADGSLVVVGRRNDLIVRGGANVYPAEVEQTLCRHPDVAEAAVLGRADERLGEIVVAVVRPHAGVALTEDVLRAFCGERLARYKVPAEVRLVSELPRNAMGKVVKKELRAWLEELA
ncbi:class I adenylate-forming enzyme family protein [Pseudonocardia oroxyli]|uniref:Long-chain acyl-CoA synthetase n=1 Tax=Pseudonocardia oroxyli TaxID=366584 RepID=A0A1G8D976_PSEOR|nr:AMP-binding protein [Pseudonocardia oroxyli]SDH53919.1 long-chain acyl-CoA synthetase [Pseudonocardia oroxyli]